MKITDDREAKYRIWAHKPQVYPVPVVINWPRFPPQKFSSYKELNQWKAALIDELIRNGGPQWKS